MLQEICEAIHNKCIIWRLHSIDRLFQRGLTDNKVLNSIVDGEIIEKYPQDLRGESLLIFGFSGNTPIHSVVSYDKTDKILYIITVYIPDGNHFEPDFKTRKVK